MMSILSACRRLASDGRQRVDMTSDANVTEATHFFVPAAMSDR
jgi:hypothetical protein